MPEIDPVVLQLKADNDKYLLELRRTTKTAEQQLGLQEKRVKSLERQMQQSSGKIGGALKGLAATLATYFTGRELVGLLDSFTRLQNNLRVAGLEGDALARVQQSLLDISQRYGTEIEGLTSVFLKASLAQKELGASTGDIIRLNEIVAASLKVTGTSAAQAQGALLQLGQALGSGVVRAEEFNSILEGALPLAQAAARGIDGMGGSVAKLRAEIAEGNVTSQQFFQGVLKGGVQTLADAEKATLTLAGGFTALTSALTVYFGEADKANGVSAALGAALKTLAENLGTVIPALAVIGTSLGVGYVTNAVAARTATLSLTAASRGLLAVLGGPVGIAVSAVGLALAYYVTQAESAEQQTRRLSNAADEAEAKAASMEQRLKNAGVTVEDLGDAGRTAAGGIDALTRSMEGAIKRAKQLEDQAGITTIRLLQMEITKAQNERLGAQNALRSSETSARAQTRTGDALRGIGGPAIVQDQRQAVIEAKRREDALRRQLQLHTAGLRAGVNLDDEPAGIPAAVPGKPEKPKKPPRQTGPSPEDIERRYLDELDSLRSQMAAAEASIAKSADERAELELRQLENARRQTLRSLDADEDYSEAQKKRVRGAVEAVAVAEREVIEFNRRAQLEREATELADERYRAAEDQLRLEYDLSTTEAQRRDIALRILDAEDAYLRAKLEAVIASKTATEAEQERARIALASLENTAGARRRVAERAHQGALGRYLDDTDDPRARAEEAAVRELQALRDGLADGLAEQIGVKNQFIKDLLTIFLDDVLFRPIAQSLQNMGGAGGLGGLIGGLFGGGSNLQGTGGIFGNPAQVGLPRDPFDIFGSIFGRASGGRVNAGQLYRVNEGASPGRVEGFRPDVGGQIIPLGRMKAARSGGTMINQTVNVDARGVNPQGFAEHIRAAVRQETMEIVAKSSEMTLKAAPGEVQRAQRYGR